MKISKRILGVALALIMIFNVFAVGTFAAADSAVTLMISTDKKTYAPGEEIVITLSEQVVEAVGAMYASGQYEIAYSSSVLAPISTSTVVDDHAVVDLSGDLNLGNSIIAFTEACQGNGSYIREEDANAYGWNETIALITTYKKGTQFDATTAPLNILSFKMKIADDAANGTYTIGFNQGGYEAYFAYSTDVAMQGIYGYSDDYDYGTTANYDCGTVTFTVGEAVEDKIVYHVKDQIQWANKDDKTVNLGVVAGFDVEDIGIEFNEAGTSTNVDKVGAIVKIGDKEDTKYERFVYEMNDGKSYYFRAVIENVPANYNGDIVVTPLVWEKNAEEPIYGDPVTISAADLATLVAKLPA